MTSSDWPPPIGSTVRAADALLYEVVARFDGAGFGEYIVLKRPVPGGWTTRLVTQDEWRDAGLCVVFE